MLAKRRKGSTAGTVGSIWVGHLQEAGASGGACQTKVGEPAAHPPPSLLWLRLGFADRGRGRFRGCGAIISYFLAACSGLVYADGAANAACTLLSLVCYPPAFVSITLLSTGSCALLSESLCRRPIVCGGAVQAYTDGHLVPGRNTRCNLFVINVLHVRLDSSSLTHTYTLIAVQREYWVRAQNLVLRTGPRLGGKGPSDGGRTAHELGVRPTRRLVAVPARARRRGARGMLLVVPTCVALPLP